MVMISVYQDDNLQSSSPPQPVSKSNATKMLRPGRTPLGKRTNSNSATSASAAGKNNKGTAADTETPGKGTAPATTTSTTTSKLQTFRRSLLSPPQSRSGKSDANANGSETKTNKKSVTFQNNNIPNPNVSTSRTAVDKENGVAAASTNPATLPVTTKTTTTTDSVAASTGSSIPTPSRRSKAHVRTKAALSRRLSSSTKGNNTASASTSTSRMPPQTPNSMLKSEVEISHADESFYLLSPAPSKPKALSVSQHAPTPVPESATVAVDEPALEIRNTEALSLMLEQQPEQQVELVVEATTKATTTTIDTAPTGEPNPPTDTTVYHQPPQRRQVDTSSRSAWSRVMPSVVAGTVAPPTNERSNTTTKQVSSPLLASGMTSAVNGNATNANTPFTSRGNGVCMDLSDIFYDAASTARKTRPVPLKSMPRLPSSRKTTVQKKKPPTVSSTRKGAKVPHETQAKAGATSQAVAAEEEEEEDWAEKQCETFSNWLNYTFQPSEERDHQVTLENGRTQDRVGLRTLVLHQRMAQARTKALDVFHSQEMSKVRKVILSEIARGRLSIRKDRDMYADLTLRNEITSLLLSYTTPWLRLGLETLFGESILPLVPHEFLPNKVSNGGAVSAARSRKSERVPISPMKLALKNFIVQRVLSDEATLAKYSKGLCKVPSGKFGEKYQAEMRTLVLHRLLVLFFFLDRARKAHVLDKSPRLFTKDAKVKSSRELLLEFCRQFLSAEGDFVKHLGRVGLKVFYKQEPVDELDFTITNLAVDLRDGVRLARMTEILTGEPPKSLLVSLRLPAVSRLQKLHNVSVVLKTLRNFGVPLSSDIASHHIVDGHREMVLKLMWSTLAHCCLKDLLDVEQVEAEIQRIRRCNTKSKLRRSEADDMQQRKQVGNPTVEYEEAELKSLLLRWCKAVCSCFGVQINDLTNDFADGKASCLLIHYYHPDSLYMDEIQSTSNDFPRNILVSEAALEKARSNERANAALANNRISELGGMPKMIPVCDTASVPAEKSMLLCLSFMCSRLMESGTEIRSCVLIQRRYRKYQDSILTEKKKSATLLIARAWRENKASYYQAQRRKYGSAIVVLQRFVKANQETLKVLGRERRAKENLCEAAVFIQKHGRGYIAKLRFLSLLRLKHAARTLQSRWRSKTALRLVRAKALLQESATTIQRVWRGVQLRCSLACAAAVKIQALWRGFFVQLQYQIDLMDIITIQCCARMVLAKKERVNRYNAVQVLRRSARKHLCQKQEEQLQSQRIRNMATSKCQMVVRRFLISKRGLQLRASIRLQAGWRRCLAQKLVKERRFNSRAAVLCQSVWRSSVARSHVQELRLETRATICLQSAWRSHVACSYVQAVRLESRAANCLQSAWRSHVACSHVQAIRLESRAASCLQSAWRSSVARSCLGEMRVEFYAASCLQSAWRSSVARSCLEEIRVQFHAASCLQSAWRSSVARSCLEEMRVEFYAASCLQSAWRSSVARSCLGEMQVQFCAVVHLQSVWRGHLARTMWSKMQLAVTCFQACARKRSARLHFCNVRAGTVTIQVSWRAQLAYKKYIASVHQIIVAQSCVRRKAAYVAAAQRMAAIIRIQSSLRRVKAMRHFDTLLRTMRNQSIAASAIQRCWRGFCVFVKFRLVVLDAITLQAAFRRELAKMLARERRGAVLGLQRNTRSWLARRCVVQLRSERDEHLRMEISSALSIQSLFRGHLVRREVLLLNARATLIQRMARGYLSQINYRMDLIDIIISQSIVRQWQARRISVLRLESALLMQVGIRMCLAKKQVIALRATKNHAECERSAALSIQRAYRRCIAVRTVSRGLAARRIQKTWRCYTVHVDFMLSILATISIQAFARRFLSARTCLKRLNAVVCVQSFARRVLRRIRVSRLERGAITLQSFARMSFARDCFRLERTAAVMIQRLVRGFLVRVELDVQNFAACEIQRIWRGYDAYIDFAWALLSVIKIQSILRTRFAQLHLERLRVEKLATTFLRARSSTILQRAFRAHVLRVKQDRAIRTLQRAVKLVLSKAAFTKLRKSTIQMQCIVRGRLARRLRPKKIKIQVLRIERANVRAKADPKLRLGNRTRTALDVLLKSTRLAEIMNAICTLEIATRLSGVCCASFAEAQAPDILFSLIRTCNRSLPHVELLHHILLTMSNVAQYDELMPSLATVTGVEVFLDLVQMFRDKDGVFCLAVSLLEQVVLCSEEFQALCSSRENLKRLKGVHALCVRKLSISHIGSVSIGRESMSRPSKVNTVRMTRRATDLRQGVRTLKRVINMVDSELT